MGFCDSRLENDDKRQRMYSSCGFCIKMCLLNVCWEVLLPGAIILWRMLYLQPCATVRCMSPPQSPTHTVISHPTFTALPPRTRNAPIQREVWSPLEWASLVAQTVKNRPTVQKSQVQSLGWKIPWRKE